MADFKNKFQKITKSQMRVVGVLFLVLLAVGLLWFNNSNSAQAEAAMIAEVYFDGDYRIADGEWQPIVKGEHIPATNARLAIMY